MAAPNTEAQAPVLAPVVDAPAPTTTNDNVVPSTEQVKETATTPALAPEDVAATTVVEPLKDDVNKLPTVTHAEAGTAHKDTDIATNVAGEQADKSAASTSEATETPAVPAPVSKADETPKETSPKKEAAKEKTEKVKAEGKGFFAKLFSSSSKTHKKPKEVKTPKAEKADPIAQPAVETTAEPIAATEATKETEAPIAPPKDAAVVPAADETTKVTESSAAAPEIKPAEPTTETKAAVVAPTTEAGPSTAAATAEAPKTEETKAAEAAKSPKVSRRLSARLGGFMKTLVPKKEHHEEAHKEETEAAGAVKDTTPASASEAPKIEKPEPIAPLEEPKPTTTSTTAAPAAVPAVATAA